MPAKHLTPTLLICTFCGCADATPPTMRIVVFNATGKIEADTVFAVGNEPSRKQLRSLIDKTVPTTPAEGTVIQVASATMLSPTAEFLNSKTISDFQKSLTSNYTKFPAFSVVNTPTAITVFRLDPDKWLAMPTIVQSNDPNRSEYWRTVVTDQLSNCIKDAAELNSRK